MPTEDARVKVVAKWSGSKSPEKEKPQQVVRRAPPSYDTTPPPSSKDDARVEGLSRGFEESVTPVAGAS